MLWVSGAGVLVWCAGVISSRKENSGFSSERRLPPGQVPPRIELDKDCQGYPGVHVHGLLLSRLNAREGVGRKRKQARSLPACPSECTKVAIHYSWSPPSAHPDSRKRYTTQTPSFSLLRPPSSECRPGFPIPSLATCTMKMCTPITGIWAVRRSPGFISIRIIPSEKIVVQADLYNPRAQAPNASSRTFYRNLQRFPGNSPGSGSLSSAVASSSFPILLERSGIVLC